MFQIARNPNDKSGRVEQLRPVAMSNLLGDVWGSGVPDWNAISEWPSAKLHLYGKHEAKPGRKMGHITATGATTVEAEKTVSESRSRLG